MLGSFHQLAIFGGLILTTIACMGQQPGATAPAAKFPSQWFFHTIRGSSSTSEREWALPCGVKLFGTPIVDGQKLEMRRQSNQQPSAVLLSLSDLSREDQQAIVSTLPQVQERFRRFALYQGAEVAPKWASAQPKFPGRFVRAVHEDKEHVYFSSAESLILVDKSAFTDESLKAVIEAVSKVRHQLVMTSARNSLRIVGVPIEWNGQDLVMEVKQPDLVGDTKFLAGMRYLVPLQSLSPVEQQDCQLVAAEVQAERKLTKLTDVQLRALPRLCLTTSGQRFVLPRSASRPDEILAGPQPDQTRPIDAGDISCGDFIRWANTGQTQQAPSTRAAKDESIPSTILTPLVDGVRNRKFWMQKDGTPYRGQLLGPAADGFIFDNPGFGKCFLPASQLDDADATIALTASQQVQPETIVTRQDNLKSIFAARVMHAGSIVLIRDEVIQLNGAAIGEYPATTYAGTRDRPFEPNQLNDLIAIRDAHAWLKENESILSMNDKIAALEKLSAKYPLNLKPAPTKLQPNREPLKWRLAKSETVFEAILVGQLDADYVFASKFGDQLKTYLVAKQALDRASAAQADKLASRLDPQDWSSDLTRHANWQNYRIWSDPQGVLRTPSVPVVVVSISESLIIFESMDGKRFSEPMPPDAALQQAVLALYGTALRSAQQQREAAEAHLTLWSFQDAEPTVRAELIGVAPDSVLVRDVNDREFLISKSTLTRESRDNFESLARLTSDLRSLDATVAWSTPRVWCTRTQIVGPAVPEYVTDNDKQLIVRSADGTRQSLKLEDLTLREQLSFLVSWRIKANELKPRPELPMADSQKTVDAWLSAEVAPVDVLTKSPALDPRVAAQIKEVFDQWQHATWPSTPIKLPRDSNLLAVNADASAGVVEVKSAWQVVDFASGKSQPIGKTPQPQQLEFGPWMSNDRQTVYWVEGGQAMSLNANASAPQSAAQLPPIMAACQSGDFQALVVFLKDNSIRRIQLSNNQVDTLVSGEKVGSQAGAVRLWASHDGQSLLFSRATQNLLFVSPRNGQPELSAFLGTQLTTASAAVGTSQAWLSPDAQPRGLTRLLASTMFLPPVTYGTAFPAQWFGAVEIDGREVFQSIGKFEDGRSQSVDKFFVTYTGPRDFFEEYATQSIEGQIDQRARMAAGGAALVHWQGDQPVVSRRPAQLPRAPELKLYEIVEALVAKRDIGQLEAIGKLFQSEPWMSYGAHDGWLAMKLQKLVDTACLHYQEHLGGDCLERGMKLASYFQRKYPDSQIAANILASLELGLAWKARGGGFADSVTPAGMKAFESHMQRAKELLEPCLVKDPCPATLDSAIDVAMGTGDLPMAKRLAEMVSVGPHAQNSNLHHSLSFLLLPRWHGQPGASETYRDSAAKRLGGPAGDVLYAQMVIEMFEVHGLGQPLSRSMRIDLARVVAGVESYYQTHSHPDLMDRALVLTAIEKDFDACQRLLKLKADKQLLPGSFIIRSPKNFHTIETDLGNRKPPR